MPASPTGTSPTPRENMPFGWAAQQADAREGPMAFVEKRDPDWKLRKHIDFPERLFD